MEDGFEKSAIAFAGVAPLDFVNAPRGPANDRWIDVAEVPLVSGNLAVGMRIPFAQDEIELSLGEMRIDKRERDAMKSQVPRRIPGIFPAIRHRHDALVEKVRPLGVAASLTFVRR